MDKLIVILIIFAVIFGIIAIALGTMLIGTKIAFNMLIKRPANTQTMGASKSQEKIYQKLMMPTSLEDFTNYTKSNLIKLKGVKHEEKEIISDDGLKLKGYFWRAEKPSDITILCVHGYKSNGIGDFAGMLQVIREKGYNFMTINHRAHGKSEGDYIGFGVLDYHDTKKWIDVINSLVPNGEIIIYGVSMGAATTMHLSSLELPKNVVCAITDCGFTSVWDEFGYQIKHLMKLPQRPFVNLVESWCISKAKYDFRTETPLKSVKNAKIPILFIHGKEDVFVPSYMAKECYDACASEKDILIVEGAGHAQSHMKAPELYEKTFFDFIDKYSNK